METIAALDIRSEEEGALANVYANQHERLDNFIFMYAVPARLFRRIGIELHSGRGYLLLFGIYFFTIFVPGLIITAITSWWAGLPPLRLALVAASLAVLNIIALIAAQGAAYKISALHRTLRNLDQIRSLIVWDRIWFGPKMSALMGGGIALVLLIVLYYLNLSVSGVKLPGAILWICGVITVFLGQFRFSTAMFFLNSGSSPHAVSICTS